MAIAVPTANSPAGKLAAARAFAATQRLIVADDFWKSELERLAYVGEIRADELATMEDAAVDLLGALADIQPLARELRMMLDGELTDEDVEEALDKLAEAASQPDVPSRWRQALPNYNFRGAAIAACDYIREEAAGESNSIQRELAQLRQGSVPHSGLSRNMKCALILMCAATGVVASAAGVAAAAAAGAAGAALTWTWVGAGFWSASVASGGVVAWSGAQCPGVLAAIGRLRR